MQDDELLGTAKKTILSEMNTLKLVAESLGSTLVEAVKRIHENQGRVIITGIGKNQFIGQKIAATLNSIGITSSFLHAADALHGDLGIVQEKDIVICLSKSGNSSEIKALLPLIKSRGNELIALVSTIGSYLDLQASISIHVPVTESACPNQLAPTNSTTAFMAVGDAIAVTLMSLKGFSAENFSQFHPGGALGKKLYLRVADLYPLNAKPEVRLQSSIQESIIEISAKRLGATAVVDEQACIKGIITDGDLRRCMHKNNHIEGLAAADIMSHNPRRIVPEAFATEALSLMRTNNITQLLVEKDGVYLGVIHIHDILKEGIV